ncbi:MAG: RDD family protein [Acidobacteriaceae bacterium]
MPASTAKARVPSAPRRFHAHESPRLHALEGRPLATFPQRLLGYLIDLIFAVVLWAPVEILWRLKVLHEQTIHVVWDFHEAGNLLFMLLYFGLFNYFGNGRTPGKWISGTRAVSLTRARMGFWQSIERALGYGAAILEGGLGFLQFFWSQNRMCAQDRLAETIVIDDRRRNTAPPSLPL